MILVVLIGAFAVVVTLAVVVVFDDYQITQHTYQKSREIAGCVLAPLTAGIVPSFAAAVRSIVLNPSIYAQLDTYSTIKTFLSLSKIEHGLYSGFGIPIAYSIWLFVGLPVYLVLRSRGWDSPTFLITTASAVGLAFGLLAGLKPLIGYAGAGALMAGVFVLVRGPRRGAKDSSAHL